MTSAEETGRSSNEPPGKEIERAARFGGVVTYLATGELDNLWPGGALSPLGIGAGSGADRRTAIYDGLALERDGYAGIDLRLAEAIESTDGRVWTISVRPGVRFSDGTPFDADAIKFNWEMLSEGPPMRTPSLAGLIASLEVEAPMTLKVTLNKVDRRFDLTIAQSALTYIGSPAAVTAKGAAFATDPVGAGPFMVREWVRDDHLTLVRNPDYHGTVYLDELVVRPIVDEFERTQALESGLGDINLSAKADGYISGRAAGLQVHLLRANLGHIAQFNMSRPPFDDARARRAVAVAVNSGDLNSAVFNGVGHVTNSIFGDSSSFYDPGVDVPKYNPAEAQRLLDELADERGTPLSFTILAPEGMIRDTATWLLSYLISNFRNIDPQVEIIAPLRWALRGSAGDFDVILNITRFSEPAPYLNHQLATGSTENWPGYSNDEMDRALELGEWMNDEYERKKAYSTVQRLMARDLPFHVLMGAQYHCIASKDIRGLESTYAIGLPLWNEVWRAGRSVS